MTPLQLNNLLKDSVSKYSHTLKHWGIGLEYMNSEGPRFSL